MKIRSFLAYLVCSSSLAFAQTTISPTTDPFTFPDVATHLPCLVGIQDVNGESAVIQYNTYYSPLLAVNPNNSSMLVSVMNQDLLQLTSNTGTTYPRTQEVAVAYSSDMGNTWSNTYIPLHICNNGTLSNGQFVSTLRYSPLGDANGTIFAAGKFNDVVTDGNVHNYSGIWFSSSQTGGSTWTAPVRVSTQNSDAYQNFTGTADGTPDLTFDPHSLSNVYMAWDRPVYSTPPSGNIYFSRSNNYGQTWSSAFPIYDIQNDVPPGGQCAGVAMATAVRKEKTKALLCSFMRYYANPTSATFDKTVATTITDRCVIRSKNNGADWDERAIRVAPFVYAQAHLPTLPATGPVFPAPDGSEKAHMVVSPCSGRVYLMWQAGAMDVLDPAVAQFHPEIWVSVSCDHGKSWSPPKVVSRTPKSLLTTNASAYQAFNGNIVFLPDNHIGFFYYDFRNYQIDAQESATDAWLAVYEETNSEHGGSTCIGLDFLQEIRVTNPSFDATIAINNSVDNLMTGIGNVLGVAGADNTIYTAYAVTNAGEDSLLKVTEESSIDNLYKASADVNERLSVLFQKILVATEDSSSSSSCSSSSSHPFLKKKS